MSGEKHITVIQGSTDGVELRTVDAYEAELTMPPSTRNSTPSAQAASTSQTDLRVVLDLAAVLGSWEDEDRNRYYPLDDGSFLVRDGSYGSIRQVAYLTESQVLELRRY